MKPLFFVLSLFVLLGGLTPTGQAQEVPAGQEIKPVPIVTGYTSFITTFQSGEKTLSPSINPILLIPAGKRWLLEGEFEYGGEFERHEDGEWHKGYERNIEYLQLNFLAHRNLTIVAGRYLTPFGIVNERLHPAWILNIPMFPMISALEMGSGNGVQLRGGVPVAQGLNLNYAAYFSALSTTRLLEAERQVGGRWSMFVPDQRLELGASFRKQLQDERLNTFGLDFTWQPPTTPFDLRMEYVLSRMGTGYWAEGAYRLRRVPVLRPLFRKSQVAARFEQFFAPLHLEPEEGMGVSGAEEGGHGALPEVDTKRLLVGWNYYFRDGLKLGLSYGREFSSMGDRNIWTIGLGYRWLF